MAIVGGLGRVARAPGGRIVTGRPMCHMRRRASRGWPPIGGSTGSRQTPGPECARRQFFVYTMFIVCSISDSQWKGSTMYRVSRMSALRRHGWVLAIPVVAVMGSSGSLMAADYEGSADYYRGYRDALRDIARVDRWRSGGSRMQAGYSGYRRAWPDRGQGGAGRDNAGTGMAAQGSRTDGAMDRGTGAGQAAVPSRASTSRASDLEVGRQSLRPPSVPPAREASSVQAGSSDNSR